MACRSHRHVAGYDTVENVLKRMQNRRATTQMYNSILNVYANDTPGRPDDAYIILKFMESGNCSAKPDIVSYATQSPARWPTRRGSAYPARAAGFAATPPSSMHSRTRHPGGRTTWRRRCVGWLRSGSSRMP